jgi:hypothetical protein
MTLAFAAPAHADRPPSPDPTLPRHLVLSEALRGTADAPPAGAVSFHRALDDALQAVAERLPELPNPYASGRLPGIGEEFPQGCRSLRSCARTEDYDEPDDLLGLHLGSSALLGLHLDQLGPAELPETYWRLTNPRRDPTDIKCALTSLALRLSF